MDEQIRAAIRLRKGLIPANTNAYRIFDGVGDGHEGVFIDTFAGHLLISHRGPAPDLGWIKEQEFKSVWIKQIEREDKGGLQCVSGNPDMHRVIVTENGVQYEVDFAAGYSQGLFLDQRNNRREVADRASGERILNCFAYTCGFSVTAAVSGARSTTSIDLSRTYLEWGKRNFILNGIDFSGTEHYFCRGDVFEWLSQFRRKKRVFDGVILDPPSFSRVKKGRVFTIEKDYPRLVEAASRIVSRGGWILACCNHHGVSKSRFNQLVKEGVLAGNGVIASEEKRPMPDDFNGEQYLKSIFLEIG